MASRLIAGSRFRRFYLAAFVPLVALVLLLGAGAAQAFVIREPGNESRANGILNLDVGGTLYNVAFSIPEEAAPFYGVPPGTFDFITAEAAEAAVAAAVAELNLAGGIDTVAAEGYPGGGPVTTEFYVAWSSEGESPPIRVNRFGGSTFESTTWSNLGPDWTTAVDLAVWARFTVVPEPGTALLMGLGLAGLGVVGRLRRAGAA